MDIKTSRTQEIVKLHNEIFGHLRQSLEKAIRIGELLTEQKDSLKHGEFTPRLKANLPFSDRTAQNYMRVYRDRDRIKTETVSDLTGAYQLIASHKELPAPPVYDDVFLNSICSFQCYMCTVIFDELPPEQRQRVPPEAMLKMWRGWVKLMMKMRRNTGSPVDKPCESERHVFIH
jgi:Protein of unknown function (DUF3102)